jgi:hypothetical protein
VASIHSYYSCFACQNKACGAWLVFC